ncbi:MAG: DUF3105 domain-containing protein [Patescibacteria group bacterium]
MKKTPILFGGVILVVSLWIVRIALTPAPGNRMEDQGREHVSPQEVENTTYNSNPPTSGQHIVTWVKPGIYKIPQSEGELLHSLEHGYVVIHYNCAVNESEACKTLITELESIATKKKLFKLIVVPRPQLDTTIALTAWNYIDKFDSFDKKRIEKFIDYDRDHGPEQTME